MGLFKKIIKKYPALLLFLGLITFVSALSLIVNSLRSENIYDSTLESETLTEAVGSNCEEVSTSVLNGLQAGLNNGATIRTAKAVLSTDYSNVYFISVELDGPGLEGDGDIATFMTTNIVTPESMMSVDAVAKEFSDWGDSSTSEAGATMASAGAGESKDCLG